MKVIFHINECDKWATTFNSAMNSCKTAAEAGQEMSACIVANGESVQILTAEDGPLAAQRKRIFEAMDMGIRMIFCNKAMSLRSITMPEDLGSAGAEVAASTAFTMIQLQEQGYAYIKS